MMIQLFNEGRKVLSGLYGMSADGRKGFLVPHPSSFVPRKYQPLRIRCSGGFTLIEILLDRKSVV